MFSYTPTKPKRPIPLSTSFIIPAVSVLIGGGIIVRLVSHTVYTLSVRKAAKSEDIIYPAYKQSVEQKTDVAKLASNADGLTKKKMYPYAALNFKRASELDPNYRDMAYGWAYATFMDKQNTLTSDDLNAIKTALDRVEDVDPLYIPALKLKLLIAKIENNHAVQQSVEQRLSLLEKAQ